ncbi:toxic anion resistance protein [Ectothiorhodospira haloalkaliphila]|uniref:Toxic anion resistance protein n=1 Tax=Ectothiorhodospira haloalkaliphila TaxID=421628 RepID=W8KU81_9GAMM|nr:MULTISPECIES: toxic anion resistance protein [Ectothiorhodospira]AHK79106.1 toxic anion resistance protein [Ectothiorhodospira haloalkaliphila]MCG5495330.1 toxic anion resistance protein [Ectothiorhodospira variabilis]MCG5497429.1 toxic anion resistance protein [Ectothiorhodospira variabilis]MCG5504928.1 toxic anion resistance protein [Ectothiorhodospira variabilis]MCG5508085.1 toxic anion resistance protein [Ectothiorhodospira variabilis]
MNVSRHDSDPLNLSLPTTEEIESQVKKESDPETVTDDPELNALADRFLDQVLGGEPKETPDHRHRQAVDEMGLNIQRQAAHRSQMLQAPIRKLAHQGDEGGPVAKSLLDLRDRMVDLDPRRHNLGASGLKRMLSRLPGVGTPLQRYFHKFETAQEALDAIIKDLESGKDMLHRDNLTLSDDQKSLRESLEQLKRQIALGRLIDRRLSEKSRQLPEDDGRKRFVDEELLFPLRQRVVDLQQQLAVSQQGILSLEVVIRNNRELMRGVDRAINVTVSALNVAVTVAMALANQRLVLDRVEAINTTTSDMIAGTAHALRTQGVEIQNRAASTMLDMEKLEEAFEDVVGAIDEVSRYRQEALPKLDAQIDRLDALAQQGNEAIERMDKGDSARVDQAI